MATFSIDSLERLGLRQPVSTAGGERDRLGQKDFLKLLTTQLTNQDPMQPMENGEFLGQMAQFSTVSGIEDLTRSFGQLAASLTQGQALQAASLVGRDVLIPAHFGELEDEGAIRGAIELQSSADEAFVEVYDAAGSRVDTVSLGATPAGLHDFEWRGNGSPAGVYELRAFVRRGGQVSAASGYLSSPVESVTLGQSGDGLRLRVQGVGEVGFDDIRRIG
ncbi:MAG: flagellar hook assembly protein FlgD [Thioalkalivibrionaceae bacterium]